MRALAVQTMPYRLDEATGLIDYQRLEENAALFRPKLIVAGAPRTRGTTTTTACARWRTSHNAYLLADMAHISGLVAAGAPCMCLAPVSSLCSYDFADVAMTLPYNLKCFLHL